MGDIIGDFSIYHGKTCSKTLNKGSKCSFVTPYTHWGYDGYPSTETIFAHHTHVPVE